MKTFIFVLSVFVPLVLTLFSTSIPTNHQEISREITIDSIPDTLFYGLTAQQITTLPNGKIKEFCIKRGISLSKFVVTRVKAENYLLKEQIRRDSIETVHIYEETDKLLGIDK